MRRFVEFAALMAILAMSVVRPSLAQGPFRESVAVNVDSKTVRSIETAREHIAQRQWSEAIPILQQLAESRESSLIPIEPGRYGNTADFCHLLISQLPSDGLLAYRQQIDPRFRERFERARETLNEDELAAIVRAAFNCSFTDEALLLLADLKFERGEFAAARQCLELLVPAIPQPSERTAGGAVEARQKPLTEVFLTCRDSDVPPETVFARLVLCSILENDRKRASDELDAFANQFPDAVGHLAGRNGLLVDTLRELQEESLMWRQLTAPSAATFAGGTSRNPQPADAVRPIRILWRQTVPTSVFTGPRVRPLLTHERPLSLHPLVVDGRVFVATSEAIFAFDLATGRPAWATDGTDTAVIYSNGREGSARLHLPDTGVPAFTLSVADNRLFARLGAPFLRKSPRETNAVSEIVALDIADREGQLALRITSDVIDPETRSPEATTWCFEGTPLISDERLFVSLRQGSPEDRSMVACFDARTGRLIWQSRVAASLNNLPDHLNLLGTNLLTLDNSRLFLTTGTGAIVSLDADTGRLLWVVTFESADAGSLEALSDPRRTGLTPCVSAHGIVIAAPPDSDLLFALEATTGRLVWSRRLVEPILHLIGVHNGRLFVSGHSLQAFDLLTGLPAWPEPVSFADHAGQILGRPALTHTGILWPVHDELLYVDQISGAINDRINLRETFGISAGNVSLTADKLIIAQPDAVVVLSGSPDEPAAATKPAAEPQ
ncbi:PQQ-binding-like beta-propeller repeat protein [bacterium]|nr:PQQ-binding-like beta-propeller repeat protein [bacterium]